MAGIQLALETGLTTFDASDLWLACDPAIELVMLDRPLAAAVEVST